jgi:hypothetical protein
MRLPERAIERVGILDAVATYEVIEAYPEDKYLPSYLVAASTDRGTCHVLFAANLEERGVRVVTAYWPNPKEWMADLRTRRRRS